MCKDMLKRMYFIVSLILCIDSNKGSSGNINKGETVNKDTNVSSNLYDLLNQKKKCLPIGELQIGGLKKYLNNGNVGSNNPLKFKRHRMGFQVGFGESVPVWAYGLYSIMSSDTEYNKNDDFSYLINLGSTALRIADFIGEEGGGEGSSHSRLDKLLAFSAGLSDTIHINENVGVEFNYGANCFKVEYSNKVNDICIPNFEDGRYGGVVDRSITYLNDKIISGINTKSNVKELLTEVKTCMSGFKKEFKKLEPYYDNDQKNLIKLKKNEKEWNKKFYGEEDPSGFTKFLCSTTNGVVDALNKYASHPDQGGEALTKELRNNKYLEIEKFLNGVYDFSMGCVAVDGRVVAVGPFGTFLDDCKMKPKDGEVEVLPKKKTSLKFRISNERFNYYMTSNVRFNINGVSYYASKDRWLKYVCLGGGVEYVRESFFIEIENDDDDEERSKNTLSMINKIMGVTSLDKRLFNMFCYTKWNPVAEIKYGMESDIWFFNVIVRCTLGEFNRSFTKIYDLPYNVNAVITFNLGRYVC